MSQDTRHVTGQARMSQDFDALTELNQAGRMLDVTGLLNVPQPKMARRDLADRLRDALTALQAAHYIGEPLGLVLDLVLEDACRLHAGWHKGPTVGDNDALRLLDGTTCKPRRLLHYDAKPVLAVFTPQVERLGLHKGRRPVAQAIEYLRRRAIPLGLVTNGRQWRLLYVDADNQAWLEWQADRWLQGDHLTPAFELLRRLLAREHLEPQADGKPGRLLQAIALTPHARLRLRCILDAIVAALYGLDRDDFRWILRDCDHSLVGLSLKQAERSLDPKGFWRVDKGLDPELRHTVLSLVAFHDLLAHIAAHHGDRDAGIAAFSAQNHGEGWQLPDTLRLADHDLGHDDRALTAQPVASRLGPQWLDWQLAQTPEASWAECERHARAILGEVEFERRFGVGEPVAQAQEPTAVEATAPVNLLGERLQTDLFGKVVMASPARRGR